MKHTGSLLNRSYTVERARRLRRVKHGALMIEIIVALGMSLLTGAAMLSLMQLTMTSRTATMNPANADLEARVQLDLISDTIRKSQCNISGSNWVCLTAGAASDITCYSDTTGDTLRLWLNTSSSPYVLQQTQTTSGIGVTSNILSGVTALQFTYYIQSSSSYNASLLNWQTTANPNAPTAAEMPKLGAIKISITYAVNGSSRQLTTFVRLRNSPYI
jgi:hypothetical protein